MSRKFVRVIKFLLAGVTVFCVSWIACVNEWHSGVRWRERRIEQDTLSTMQTLVGYSEGKLAEMDKPSPVACSRLPALPNVPYFNRTWSPEKQQLSWQPVKGTSVSLYAAYYDQRSSQHYVRILAIFHGRNISAGEPLYCQTRSVNPNDYSVEVVAAKSLEIWWHEWDKISSEVDSPLLLSCPLREPLMGPSVVSIVTQPCDNPSNGFHLQPSSNSKYNRTFTICVKDMTFEKDISHRLVEWIETNKLLGVELIDMYVDTLSKESEDVLLYYRAQGYVRLFHVPIMYDPERSLWQRRRDHIITYNDCLYRNIVESKFIVPLDIDEILLPKIAYTWQGLLKRLSYHGWNPTQYSAILVRNVFFFDFLQGLYKPRRHTNKSKVYTKRDDVRINNNINLDKNIELISDTNSLEYEINKEVMEEVHKYNKYKCGKELPIPKLASHTISSAIVSPIGHYSKSFMLTQRVLTAFNHYPLASLGSAGIGGWSAPFDEVQLNHYKESCNSTLVGECEEYARRARLDRSAVRLRRRLTRALAVVLCSKLNIY